MTSLDSSVEIIEVISDSDSTPLRSRRGIDSNTPSPRRTLLESVSARFEQNQQEREERLQHMRSKQEMEKVHSQYIKRNVASRYELDRARPVVDAWAQRNGRQRAILSARQHQRLMEIETVDRRNLPVRHQRGAAAQDVSNNADDYSESCSVIGCGVKFTCQQEHRIHDSHFEHSPCNPLLNMSNGRLPDHPLGYICPKCGEDFQRGMDCQEHMVLMDHLSLFSPLSVCAYMCPQCLLFFPEKMRCHNHMEELRHFEAAYPFINDLNSDPSLCPRTIPVPFVLGRDFIRKVKVRGFQFSVSCVECGLSVGSRQELEQHWQETEESHMFMSCTQGGSLTEVFAEYLGDRTCNACLQIFNGQVPPDNIHHCATGMQGILVDINCQSFSEFVRRSGLTLSQTISDTVASPEQFDPSSESSSVLLASSTTSGSALGSPEQIFHISSSSGSSNQNLNQGTPGKKRVHPVTILSSSSEDESPETLTGSARKRRKVEKTGEPPTNESMFSKKMVTLAAGLSRPKESSTGFTCSARNLECDEGTSNSLSVRSGNEDTSSISNLSPPETKQCSDNLDTKGKPFQDCTASLPNDRPFPTTFSTSKDSNKLCKTSEAAAGFIKTYSSTKSHSEGNSSNSVSSNVNSVSSNVNSVQMNTNSYKKTHSKDRQVTTSGSSAPSVDLVAQSHRSSTFRDSAASASGGTSGATDPQNLDSMRLIIFLDLDNWGGFFKKLPQCLPDKTFVWAFYGGKNLWKPPRFCVAYQRLLDSGCLHFHEQCGSSKDAADFAICLTVGKMDERLPKYIPFTILSGDKGFLEVERQMKLSTRRTVVIDPHNVMDKSSDVLYALIVSVMHD